MPHPKPAQCVSPINLSQILLKVWSEKNTISISKNPRLPAESESLQERFLLAGSYLYCFVDNLHLQSLPVPVSSQDSVHQWKTYNSTLFVTTLVSTPQSEGTILSTILNGKFAVVEEKMKFLSGNFRCLGSSPANPPDSSITFLILHLF